MPRATYTVLIDFDKDKAYSNALSNVTYYVKSLKWSYGVEDSFEEFAPTARLTCTLDNTGRDFDLEDSSAPFYGLLQRGLLFRVVGSSALSSTVGLFTGRIKSISHRGVGWLQTREVVLEVGDFMDDLLYRELDAKLFTGVKPGQIIRDVFDRSALVYPYVSDYWYLGMPGYSELGTTTTLFSGANLTTSVGDGQSTLSFVGDKPYSNVQTYLRDLVAAEMGGVFFFSARDGITYTFLDRHWAINPTVSATITDVDIDEAEYVRDGDVVNQMTVQFFPRRVGTAGSVLWSSTRVIRLKPQAIETVTARYVDPTQPTVQIAGFDFKNPQPGTDYIARAKQDGTGADLTSLLVVSTQFDAASARVTVQNTSFSQDIYVTKLELRGTPLISSQAETVTATAPASQIRYGIASKSTSLRLVDNAEDAFNLAQSTVTRFADPKPRYRTVSFWANKSEDRLFMALKRFVGEVVRIETEDVNHHNQVYLLVGEQHMVMGGDEAPHYVTWVLKPVDFYQYWMLGVAGYSELGSTTILAF